MQVRHDTTLLERAIDLQIKRQAIPMLEAEAAAHDKIARANGFRRMASGAAVAVASVGIGIGAWLVFGSSAGTNKRAELPPISTERPKEVNREEVSRPKQEERIAEEGKSQKPVSRRETRAPESRPEPPQPPNPVTTDYTKFQHRTVSLNGSNWVVTSGHHYPTENSPSWDTAWCYTRVIVEGVDLNLDLVNRPSPTARPLAPISPPATFRSAGLTEANARELASKCEWLDGATFGPGDFAERPGRPKAPALTMQDGWDALGHDLPDMPVSNISLMECRNRCEADRRCQALTYNSTHSACFMKSDATVLVRSEEATMAAKESVYGSLVYSSLVFARNTVLVGTPYASSIAGYADCVAACAKDQRCAGFNHDANKLCTMFSTVFSSSDSRGVVSGVKGAQASGNQPAPRNPNLFTDDGFMRMLQGAN